MLNRVESFLVVEGVIVPVFEPGDIDVGKGDGQALRTQQAFWLRRGLQTAVLVPAGEIFKFTSKARQVGCKSSGLGQCAALGYERSPFMLRLRYV